MKVTAKEITHELLGKLWEQYLARVPYAKKYADLVNEKGGKVVHDHIAFGTFNIHTGEQPGGIMAIQHLIEILGYQPAGKYVFPKKKLNAVHFEYPGEIFPKIFVSQLEVAQLPGWAQQMISETVIETPYLLSDNGLSLLQVLRETGSLTREAGRLLVDDLAGYFRRPWNIPSKKYVLEINDVSPYAAWVLLHGNSVYHFAALVNEQGVDEWPDLETTCEALKQEGIPMKETIEGEKDGKLRQSATLAVKEDVEVRGDDGNEPITWTYAYYEFTQRGFSAENGVRKMFTGFLNEQDRHLFDITKTRDN